MNKFLNQINILLSSEQPLLERSVVDFGGQNYPNYGWCLTVIGGPASGKSTFLNKAVLIQGKEFNIDNIAEAWQKHYLEFFEKVSEKFKDYLIQTFPHRIPDLSNQEDVSELHYLADRTTNKYSDTNSNYEKGTFSRSKDIFFNNLPDKDIMSLNEYNKKLPNVIYDVTGKNFFGKDNVYGNLKILKDIGYKTSVLWVLTDIENSVKYNLNRDRTVPTGFLLQTHKKVYNNMLKVLNRLNNDTIKIDNLDELWILYTSSKNRKEMVQKIDRKGNIFYINNKTLQKIIEESGIKKYYEIEKIIDKEGSYNIKIIKKDTNDNLIYEKIIGVQKSENGEFEDIPLELDDSIKIDRVIDLKEHSKIDKGKEFFKKLK